jgi:2-polyprenyl-6-methoxyphenol hydroxylase-like FAD-dependent oxidoreductase
MRHSDVVIVGGGLAGSLAAAMLGRAGIDTLLIDPHPSYPADFRCEKLDGPQLDTLRLTGLADVVVNASTPDNGFWVARSGRVIERRPGDQRGILYDTLVNTVRSQIPDHNAMVVGKVIDIATGPERQTITLSNGETVFARLVVVATGLNIGLSQKLGIGRKVISPAHSISVGFDVQPARGGAFAFPALTYFAEHIADRMAYITLFPIGAAMRANLFAYRDLHDPWLKEFRDAPREKLYEMWPKLRALMGDFIVPDFIKIRPVDLYVTEGYRQQGLVLVGDAFATSCPAAGTGARKVLTDVERLCNRHVPGWLATPGMDAAKIAAFYDDPVKHACDVRSSYKAFELRSFSIDPALRWAALRWAKFLAQGGRGTLRRLLGAQPPSTDVPDEDLMPGTPKMTAKPISAGTARS